MGWINLVFSGFLLMLIIINFALLFSLTQAIHTDGNTVHINRLSVDDEAWIHKLSLDPLMNRFVKTGSLVKGDLEGRWPYLYIAKETVDSKAIKDGSIKAEDVNSSQIQLRIWGKCENGAISAIRENGEVECASSNFLSNRLSCPTGYAIRRINTDGTIECERVGPTQTHLSLADVLAVSESAGHYSIRDVGTVEAFHVSANSLDADRIDADDIHSDEICLNGWCITNWGDIKNNPSSTPHLRIVVSHYFVDNNPYSNARIASLIGYHHICTLSRIERLKVIRNDTPVNDNFYCEVMPIGKPTENGKRKWELLTSGYDPQKVLYYCDAICYDFETDGIEISS